MISQHVLKSFSLRLECQGNEALDIIKPFPNQHLLAQS